MPISVPDCRAPFEDLLTFIDKVSLRACYMVRSRPDSVFRREEKNGKKIHDIGQIRTDAPEGNRSPGCEAIQVCRVNHSATMPSVNLMIKLLKDVYVAC